MRMILTAGCLALLPGFALADEISGHWCSDLGAHVFIQGNRIQSPGGQMTDGIYGHHSYAYVVPEGEKDAGLKVFMQQLSEARVLVTTEGRDTEEWRRCQMIS